MKNLIKISAFGVTAMLLASPLPLGAKVLEPQEALARLSQDKTVKKAPSLVNELSLQTTVNDKFGSPALYVFSKANNGGYYILSAESDGYALLGYGDEGSSISSMPDNLNNWLETYAVQISDYREAGMYAPVDETPEIDDLERIEPLCKARWDQGYPYNSMCPSGYPAGCIPVAMAQVMRYFAYPSVGTGIGEYNCDTGMESLDLSKHPFDWDNIPYYYSDYFDEADQPIQQKVDAVGNLLLCCGASANVSYDWGGTSGFFGERCLYENFGYGDQITYASPDSYEYHDWVKLVHDNLKNIGPVLYSGLPVGVTAHAFVCDGYSSDGFFHFNFGWGGYSDGYFRLKSIGLGRRSKEYNYWQSAILGINPKNIEDPCIDLVIGSYFSPQIGEIKLGESLSVSVGSRNSSYRQTEVSFGTVLIPMDGGDNIFLSPATDTKRILDPKQSDVECDFSVILPVDLKDGLYKLKPSYVKPTGEDRVLSGAGYILCEVKGGVANIYNENFVYPVVYNFVIKNAPLVIEETMRVEFDVTNPNAGMYNHSVYPSYRSDDGGIGIQNLGKTINLYLEPYETRHVEMDILTGGLFMYAKTYQFTFLTDIFFSNHYLCDDIDINVYNGGTCDELSIHKGESYSLQNENGAKWFTEDNGIATVDANGKVKGVGVGKTYIKCLKDDYVNIYPVRVYDNVTFPYTREGIVYDLDGRNAVVSGYQESVGKDVVLAEAVDNIPVAAINANALSNSDFKSVVIPKSVSKINVDAFSSTSVKSVIMTAPDIDYMYDVFYMSDDLIKTFLAGNAHINSWAEASLSPRSHRHLFVSDQRQIKDFKEAHAWVYPMIGSMFCSDNLWYIPTSETECDIVDALYGVNMDRLSIDESVSDGSKTYQVTGVSPIALGYRDNISNLTLPQSIKVIGDNAFERLESLLQINIGENVTAIGPHAFDGCDRLNSMTVNALLPPVCGESALAGIDKDNCILYVNNSSLELYRNAEQWCEFKHIMPITSISLSTTDNPSLRVVGDSVIFGPDTIGEVYTPMGTRIFRGHGKCELTPGIYIVKANNYISKILIK